jgi:hypothetical protein
MVFINGELVLGPNLETFRLELKERYDDFAEDNHLKKRDFPGVELELEKRGVVKSDVKKKPKGEHNAQVYYTGVGLRDSEEKIKKEPIPFVEAVPSVEASDTSKQGETS